MRWGFFSKSCGSAPGQHNPGNCRQYLDHEQNNQQRNHEENPDYQTKQAGRCPKALSSTANDSGTQNGHSTRDRCDVEGPALGRHLTKVQPRRDASAAMISFDTNILVYATGSISDVNVMRARDLVARAMRTASRVLLLQALRQMPDQAIAAVLNRAGKKTGRGNGWARSRLCCW